MGTIEIVNEPHQLIVNGETILMQSDPTNSPEWERLLDTSVTYPSDPKKRDKVRTELVEALAALAEGGPEGPDADKLRKLDMGIPTLNAAARAYVREVTGFPTQPSSTSTKP